MLPAAAANVPSGFDTHIHTVPPAAMLHTEQERNTPQPTSHALRYSAPAAQTLPGKAPGRFPANKACNPMHRSTAAYCARDPAVVSARFCSPCLRPVLCRASRSQRKQPIQVQCVMATQIELLRSHNRATCTTKPCNSALTPLRWLPQPHPFETSLKHGCRT